MLYPEYQKIIHTLDRIDTKLNEMEIKIDKIYEMVKSITDEMEKYKKPKTLVTWDKIEEEEIDDSIDFWQTQEDWKEI